MSLGCREKREDVVRENDERKKRDSDWRREKWEASD